MKNERIDIMSGLNDEFYTYKLLHPFFWLEEGATLDDENADLLHSMVELPVNLSVGAQWTMVAVGAAAALVAGFFLLRMFYFKRNRQDYFDDDSEKDKDSIIKP